MKKNTKTKLIWFIMKKSYKNNLAFFSIEDKNLFMKKAQQKYYELLCHIPKFHKNDALELNLLNAVSLASIYITFDSKPDLEKFGSFYEQSMLDSKIMKLFYKLSKYYKKSYQNKYKKIAMRCKNATNSYSWKLDYVPGKDINSFTLNITQCGICKLFKELNISEIVPLICHFDFTMANYTNTIFTRTTTLASNGSLCDCHYSKKF